MFAVGVCAVALGALVPPPGAAGLVLPAALGVVGVVPPLAAVAGFGVAGVAGAPWVGVPVVPAAELDVGVLADAPLVAGAGVVAGLGVVELAGVVGAGMFGRVIPRPGAGVPVLVVAGVPVPGVPVPSAARRKFLTGG